LLTLIVGPGAPDRVEITVVKTVGARRGTEWPWFARRSGRVSYQVVAPER
jgi:hypothetical protein